MPATSTPDWTATGGEALVRDIARLWGWDPDRLSDEQREQIRERIEDCLSQIAARITVTLDEARRAGELPAGTDTARMASLLVDCWEGAALRSRLRGDPSSLTAMLDFFFRSAAAR